MERLAVLIPALVPITFFAGSFIIYTSLALVGKAPKSPRDNHSAFFNYFISYFVWLITPAERAIHSVKLSPNHLTITSLFVCAGAGTAIATGHMATAGWLYIAAGGLDVLDGRLARAKNQQTSAGAFLDSVTDRWGELFVFAGFAWFLRDSPWLWAVMAAVTGSVMVSYTRARGESLGIMLDGGHMQRPERMTLVSIGTLITAYFDAASHTAEYGPHVIGVALLIVGVGSTATAVNRWYQGYRMLEALDAERDGVDPESSKSGRPVGRGAASSARP